MSVFSSVAFVGLPTLATLAVWLTALVAVFNRYRYGSIGALMLTVTTLSASPNAIQSVYWFSGLFNYGVPLALFCVLAWLITAQTDHPLRLITCTLLAFVIAGISDTLSVLQPVALVFLAILLPGARKRSGAALAGAVIGLIIVAVAPGNVYRRAYYPEPDLWLSLLFAARTTAVPLTNIIRNAPLAAVAVVVAPALVAEPAADNQERLKIKKTILILLVGVLSVDFVAMFLGYYTFGGPLLGRSAVVPVFFSLAGIMVTSAHAGRLFNRHGRRLAAALVIMAALACSAQAIAVNERLYQYATGQTASLEGLESDDAVRPCIERLNLLRSQAH
jgi:hypothetical protein